MDYAVPTNPSDDAYARGVVYNSAKPIGGIRYVDQRDRSVIIDKLSKKVEVRVAAEAVIASSTPVIASPQGEAIPVQPTTPVVASTAPVILSEAKDPQTAEPKLVIERGEATAAEAQVEETVTAITEMPVTSVAAELAEEPKPSEQESTEPFDAHREALLAYEESMRELGVSVRHRTPVRSGIYYSKPGAYVVEINGIPTDFSAEGINRPVLSSDDQLWLKKAQIYFLEARDDANRKIGSAVAYTTPDLLEALWATAAQVGVDPKRFLVQVYNESRFNPHARGDAGERGIGQFMRNTAKMLELDWAKMTGGEETLAYQARCAAEFVKSVGESRYNGGNPEYVRMISSRMNAINHTRVGDYTCSSEACV